MPLTVYGNQIKIKLGSARNTHELSDWVDHLLRILVEDIPLCLKYNIKMK